jgi:type II secretory ATPase GspE/PulE/Tfp pilus assembly ATPase PilB-like protein
MSFNELISGQIMRALANHDPQFGELSHDQVANRVTRYCFMGAVARINGLAFFPKVAEFCDGSLHTYCDPTVLTRGLFSPLSITGDKLIVAVANPWSPLPDEYLAPRFPDLEIVKIVTLASEIARAIESVATNSGPSRSELEAIDVEDNDEGIRDFDVTTDYTEPMAQLVATVMADAVKTRASDIHFKVEKESFYYAYRVDGDIGNKVEIR